MKRIKQWLEKIKLATKIQLGIGVLIVFGLLMGSVAISTISSLINANDTLYTRGTVPISNILELNNYFLNIRVTIRDIVLAATPEEREGFNKTIDQLKDYLSQADEDFIKQISSAEEKEKYDLFKTAMKKYLDVVSRIQAFANNGDPYNARELMYGDAKAITKEVKDTMDDVLITKLTSSETLAKNNENQGKKTKIVLIILVSIIALFSFGVAAYLTLNIKKILTSFNREMATLIEAAKQGNLSHRAEVQSINLEFRPIALGINETLDAVITPLNMAADYVDKIASGQIPAYIEEDYNGEFNAIKDNLNKCITSINNLITDADQLSSAAVQGQLETRADASRHEGDYQRIINGVNATLDALINPLNVAAAIIDRIAVGDIPDFITDTYRGDFNQIKQNLNLLIDSQNTVTSAALSIASGDLSVKLETRSPKDQLILAMQGMITAVKNIVTEVKQIAKYTINGQLDQRADAASHKGDYQTVIAELNNVMNAFARPIEETSQVLQAAADRDLTLRMRGNYQGQIADLKTNINNTLDSLQTALKEVADTVSQVTSGADQIADASQSLSQGATEQASSLEEITSSMAEIGSQTKINAENANQANTLAKSARAAAESGESSMQGMVDAMQNINESSVQISRIIKVIDEIAFQTNLLALNAAVEAARAGRHGKGFAVVADEVRNLAGRSAKAAKETSELIESSKDKVKAGTEIAQTTSSSFNDIVSSIVKVTDIIGEIAAASSEQAQGVIQINQGLGQIDKVTQQNTANAEETASAAEQMASQAVSLQKLTAQFRLD